MAREIDEVAGRGQDLLGALRHFRAVSVSTISPGRRSTSSAPSSRSSSRICIDSAGWRDRAILGGPAEMPVLGERSEITQLAQRDHADKLILSQCTNQYD